MTLAQQKTDVSSRRRLIGSVAVGLAFFLSLYYYLSQVPLKRLQDRFVRTFFNASDLDDDLLRLNSTQNSTRVHRVRRRRLMGQHHDPRTVRFKASGGLPRLEREDSHKGSNTIGFTDEYPPYPVPPLQANGGGGGTGGGPVRTLQSSIVKPTGHQYLPGSEQREYPSSQDFESQVQQVQSGHQSVPSHTNVGAVPPNDDAPLPNNHYTPDHKTPPYRGASDHVMPIPYKQSQISSESDRPKIYTFWTPVTPMKLTGMPGTGMTSEADGLMFGLWESKWRELGWEPRVLTMEDARKHPRFEEFYSALQKIPLWGNRRAGINREYNQACYLRWLAMAALPRGGVMSDYDVLPIRSMADTSNNNYVASGRFTTYEQGGVPSLLSGTKEEWERMAWTILQNGLQHEDDGETTDLWSDMFALKDLQKQNPSVTNVVPKVTDASTFMTGRPMTPKECGLLQKFDAIHFSHNSIQLGITQEGEKFRDRPKIAMRVFDAINRECQNQLR